MAAIDDGPDETPAGAEAPAGTRPAPASRASRALLVLILVALGVPKLVLSLNARLPDVDGGYYTDVAQHVRDGQGLVTSISLYHQGYESFPHPTSVSPLWPLVYGYTARVMPILAAGTWLATLFYFIALVCAYGWAQELFPRALFPRRLPALRAGHVLVLLIGLHREFFIFTSLPYTEGLAFALLFGGLWRFSKCLERGGARAGFEVGLWLALMMLARGQLMIVALALYPALAWGLLVGGERTRRLRFLAASVVPVVLLLGWHYLYVRSFVLDAGVASILRFDRARATAVLSAFDPLLHVEGLGAYVLDRAKGFLVAFDPAARHGYYQSFTCFHYALIACLPWVCVSAWRERRRWRQGLRSPAGVHWIFVALVALGGFFSIHTIHKTYYTEWNFARRQALSASLLIFFALHFLLQRRRLLATGVGAAILIASCALGYRNLIRATGEYVRAAASMPDEYRPALVNWLNQRRAARGTLTVAMTAQEPQRLAYLTPAVGYHWIYWETTPRDLKTLVEDFGIDYVVVGKDTQAWAFCRDQEEFRVHFRRVRRNLSGYEAFAPIKAGEEPGPNGAGEQAADDDQNAEDNR